MKNSPRQAFELGERGVGHALAEILRSFENAVEAAVEIEGGAIGPISYTAFMCVCNALFMAASSNFNAMAMEPQGRIAGTASSLFGSVTTMMQATIAHVIGLAYNGTMIPLATGMVACGVAIIVIAAITEKGKLFGKH